MRFKIASGVRGLSDEAFREAFGTEDQCRSTLVRLRWPDGFVCRSCGHRGHCVLGRRGMYQCNRCKTQGSPTAGKIFHATKLPLTLWFVAIHLIVTAKNGISSVELGRRLGVKQPTAWTMKQKIMAVMARREGDTPLSGRVEMDDAYLGGARSGGKRRGAAGKTPFVAAVSTSPEGQPRKVKLAAFKWVNTMLGNIKSAITGTYRKLGPDHAECYLASFCLAHNRRYQPQTMFMAAACRRATPGYPGPTKAAGRTTSACAHSLATASPSASKASGAKAQQARRNTRSCCEVGCSGNSQGDYIFRLTRAGALPA